MSRFARFSNAVLGSPLLWGVAITVGFYSLLDALPASEWRQQWPSLRDPIGYLSVEMFFVALASLAIKAFAGLTQSRLFQQELLGPAIPVSQPNECAATLSARLSAFPEAQQASYLVRRLQAALKFVERRGTADSLEDELKYLSSRDVRSLWQSYGWVLVASLLLPIFGVCGAALNAASPPGAANGQATFLVLALLQVSLLVIAAAAMISFDLRLLRRVDAWAAEQLGSRFQRTGASSDPQVLAVRRMADAVVQVTDRLVQRQIELWQSTIQAAHGHWNHLADATLLQTQSALETSLRKVLVEFADRLASQPQVTSETLSAPAANDPREPAAKLKLFAPEQVHHATPAETKAA